MKYFLSPKEVRWIIDHTTLSKMDYNHLSRDELNDLKDRLTEQLADVHSDQTTFPNDAN